ncbi:hypothetical protein QEN19_000230 [Hanseniaspora menglaensis]
MSTSEQFEKTKESGKEFGHDSKKLTKSCGKDVVNSGEAAIKETKEKCEPYVKELKNIFYAATDIVKNKATYIYQKTLVGLQQILVELQNPIVFSHLITYGVIVTKVFNGYAYYHTRYLKGKTDNQILLASGGTLLALFADGVFIKKYCKKFDKK